MKWIRLCLLLITSTAMGDSVLNNGSTTCSFDDTTQRITVSDTRHGDVLFDGEIVLRNGGANLQLSGSVEVINVGNETAMHFPFQNSRSVDLFIRNEKVVFEASGATDLMLIRFDTGLSEDGVPAILKDSKPLDDNVLVTRLGNASIPGADSLFDKMRDLAIQANGDADWYYNASWKLTSSTTGSSLQIKLISDYYRSELGITYYTPQEKRSFWHTAPVVALTWYGVAGREAKQELSTLRPEIDLLSEKLLPYAEQMVFQIDDNYDYDDDAKMRQISDYIRGKGFIPGVWFLPFGMIPPAECEALGQTNPEYFLQDQSGDILGTFGGRNWAWRPIYYNDPDHPKLNSTHCLNVTNPDALENYFKPYWVRASETWNFDYFKVDGQGQGIYAVLKKYGEESVNGGGIEGYRTGLAAAREIVGPDKYMNSCARANPSGAGYFQGSRCWGDTGKEPQANHSIVNYNFMNNLCWWCDPDATALAYERSLNATRLNAQARALTGQAFVTDDHWQQVSDAKFHAWQRCIPNLNIFPVNLYEIHARNEAPDYDLYNLRIAKPWGTYDVAGFSNLEEQSANKSLELSRLRLEARNVHIFDFWSSSYLGVYGKNDSISFNLGKLEAKVLSLVPVSEQGLPVLISTSRHVSQGGLDLDSMTVEQQGNTVRISGQSSHLVANDPYELVFVNEELAVVSATSSIGQMSVTPDGQITRVQIVPSNSGSMSWEVVFGSEDGAPVFNSDPITLANATLSQPYSASIADKASDANGDTLSFSKVSGPSWLSVASEGTLGGTPAQLDLGANSWMVQVADGNGGTDTATLNISVVDNATLSVDAGADFTVDANVTGSAAVTLNATGTGNIVDYIWKESSTRIGTGQTITVSLAEGIHSIVVRVKDTFGNVVRDTVVVTVLPYDPGNSAPVFDAIPAESATEGIDFSTIVTASDVDGDALTFTKVSGTAWISVAANGSVFGTPGASDVGTASVMIEVSDGQATDRGTMNISVVAAGAEEDEIINETFDGNLNAWILSQAKKTTNSRKIYEGSGALQLNKSGTATIAVSTAGYADLVLSCAMRTDDFDNGEEVKVQYNAGNGWNTALAFVSSSNKSYEHVSISLPNAAASANFQLRFNSNSGGRMEKSYIDSLSLVGTK